MALLEVSNINTYRGTVQVLFNVSLKVDQSEVVCLLGRNGAGKSTTIGSIVGLVPAYSGSIRFKGAEIVEEELNPEKCTDIVSRNIRRGMGFVPEDRRIFPNLTVLENLKVAAKPSASGKTIWDIEKVFRIFPVLATRRSNLGYYLSGGEKQMLTIARTLMGNPDLLILDEPLEGLAPSVVRTLKTTMNELKDSGMAMIIAEQQHQFIQDLCSRVYFLELGAVQFAGKMEDFDRMFKKKDFTLNPQIASS